MMRIPGPESIGWALLNSLWQFGLLTLLYLLVTGRDNRFTAAVRHNIALSFSVAGSGWFIAGLFLNSGQAPVLSVIAAPVFSTQSTQYLVWDSFLSLLNQVVAFLPWLYAAILLLRTGHVFFETAIKKKSTENTTAPDFGSDWKYFLDKCCRELDIRRSVLLRWTSGPGMARTYGFLRPVVLFPVALLSRLSVDQVEAILVHELAHIRRNDYLTHLWMSLFRFVFYFNPFAAFLYDAVSCEREQACDDLVLGRSYSATVYAHALLALEQFRQAQLQMSLAASGHRPLQLADRIRRIAGLPVSAAPRGPLLRIILTVFIAAVALCGFRPLFEQPAKKNKSGAVKTAVVLKFKLKITAAAPVSPSLPPPALPELRLAPAHAPVFSGQKDPGPVEPASSVLTLQIETDSDASHAEQTDPYPAPEYVPDNRDAADEDDQPVLAARKITRNFSYRNSETAAAPAPAAETLSPYVPSSSFEYPVADSVPAIALQSLQQNKPAVMQLLAKWKALQLQQNISRTLEAQYLQLKVKTQRSLNAIPAQKESIKKSLQNLKEQMKIRKAEIDRLSAILADEPVIYI